MKTTTLTLKVHHDPNTTSNAMAAAMNLALRTALSLPGALAGAGQLKIGSFEVGKPPAEAKPTLSDAPTRVTIQVRQEGEEAYTIGTVTPPAKLQHLDDERLAKKLDRLWDRWRKEEPEPDADSEFVAWLCDEHGWTEVDGPTIHTIEV